MILLALAAGFGVLALILRLPSRLVWIGFVCLLIAGIVVHLILPEGHALRRAAGGDWRTWALPLLIGAGVLAYRRVLVRLRARALPSAAPAKETFAAAELERYARHIVLREVGGMGQKRLKQARVLVVGAGGLGSPALLYLTAAGVGTIGVVDDDEVSNSNLQRQIIHTDQSIGSPKVQSAQRSMKALNPYLTVVAHQERLGAARAADLFADYDLVLDGTDNFDTRYLVNQACVATGKPLISAAITQWEGQIGLFDPARGGPCYACVFPERPADGLAPACAEAGVIAPLPGVMGAMMALEAVKYLTGAGSVLRGALLLYDGLWAETRKIHVDRRADCPICGQVQEAEPPRN